MPQFFEHFVQDIRYGLRMAFKSPGFVAIAVLSIALGIGATTAIFSVVYAVLVDPYPYRDADRIGFVQLFNAKGDQGPVGYSMAEYLELKSRVHTVEDMVAFTRRNVVMTGSGMPEAVVREEFSPNGLDFFGVPALLGRNFSERDAKPGQAPEPVAVLAYQFWQRHYSGQPDVLGQKIRLDDKLYTIVGVLPIRFTWNDADVYAPLDLRPSNLDRVSAVVRVRAGIPGKEIGDEFQILHDRFAKENPGYAYPERPFRSQFVSVNEGILGQFANTLLALLAAVAFLLLIACGNVANLLLARATTREGEIAVRTSLGAGRGRIIQQLLTESVLLSLTGGVLGVLLAQQSAKAVVALMPFRSIPHEAVIGLNWPVLWFAFAVSVMTGIVFGLAPALQISKRDQSQYLKEGGRGASVSAGSRRLRDALIVVEITLSLVLLTGAGLAIQGLMKLEQQKLGYDPDGVLSFYVPLPSGRYTKWSERQALFTNTLNELRRLPKVEAASATSFGAPPFSGGETPYLIDGHEPQPGARCRMEMVSDGFFETIRTPLLQGRYFDASDMARARSVAVVTDTLVKQAFPSGHNPIGSHIRLTFLGDSLPPTFTKAGPGEPSFEIVGVVGSPRNRGLQDPPVPAAYIPNAWLYPPGTQMLVRASGNPLDLAEPARRAFLSEAPDQPITLVEPLSDRLKLATAYPRFASFLFGVFAAVGLLLAAAGIFSVVSFAVASRTREFGIRLALGATSRQVLSLVLGATGRVLAVGLVIGLVLSYISMRALAGRLQGVESASVLTVAAVPFVLVLAALVACYLPARSATRIAPAEALRHE
jgi:predicted permease